MKTDDKLDEILRRLEILETDTKKMSSHIHFDEQIHEQIKKPFFTALSFFALPAQLPHFSPLSLLQDDKFEHLDRLENLPCELQQSSTL